MRVCFVRSLVAALLTTALGGCASMAVSSFTEPGFEPDRYRTYQWANVVALPTGDPRLDSNPFFETQIRSAVDRGLAAARLEKHEGERADLVVHFYVSLSQEVDIRGINREYQYCTSDDCGPFVHEAGTLFIDLVDQRTNALVWRGWATGDFRHAIDDQRALQARVDEAVRRILARLPRRL